MDMNEAALTPAEAMMLMDLRGAAPAALFKVSAMALLLRRVLQVETKVQRGWIRTRMITLLRLGQVPALFPHERAVVRLVQVVLQSQPEGAAVEAVVSAAKREYGSTLYKYRQDLVLPALLDRRMVEIRRSRWFKIERPAMTPVGLAVLGQLNAMLDRGRKVPGWLDTDPRQAALTAAALGPLVLLVSELRPHLARLAAAMPRRAEGGDAGGGFSGSDGLSVSHDQPGFHHPHDSQDHSLDFGAWDSGAFDAGAFDGFDNAMSSFDAATDGAGGHGGGGGDGGSSSGGE